jgi:tetratricopeptide (TPR) repeat protein
MAARPAQLIRRGVLLAGLWLAGCVAPQVYEAPRPQRYPTPYPAPAPPATPQRGAVPAPAPDPVIVQPPPAVRSAPPVGAAGSALLRESRAHQSAGRYDQAAAAVERALRIEPRQPLLWLELGRIRLQEGDYAQAESLGRRAYSLSAGDPEIEARAQQLIRDALQSGAALR